MLGFNPDATGPNAMSWNQWCDLLHQRAERAAMPNVPSCVTGPLGEAMKSWIERVLFAGTATPSQQHDAYRRDRRGMLGRGMYGPSGGAPPHIINPWEKHRAEAEMIKRRVQGQPRHAAVYSARGPGFLETLRHQANTDPGQVAVTLTTEATMTPYDPTASGGGKSGTQPIMHYLRHGWKGDRAEMRPRWPNGVSPFMVQDKPYRQALTAIMWWILNPFGSGGMS